MKNYMPRLHNALPLFLLFLITFSVQGQPTPPGYKYDEVTMVSVVQKRNVKKLLTVKGPYTVESDNNLTNNDLDKIYKTFICLEDNLRLSNTEKVKENANDLAMLLTGDMDQIIDTALFDQIRTNAKLICGTSDLNQQRYYFSFISYNMHQLRIK
ncbi:DUF3347 domain-containing protein [Flavobacterium sp. GT3R68]|uniref:DUF3347 domain-containing protein n=1 Tax=Flavobacterium sp. GT3R68 TaxID=2594437 RepID=UPI000F89A7CF|nr:DUF3347 domain-containing protein [Flavobacterium sp. GT3R68]RTY95139.1 DUF3347 domain-containing protein [Flavobacterium sp. GSN2]TRW91119.1 DUF3347 domain-containing protein [Flavobacterium sp. GT3R68]